MRTNSISNTRLGSSFHRSATITNRTAGRNFALCSTTSNNSIHCVERLYNNAALFQTHHFMTSSSVQSSSSEYPSILLSKEKSAATARLSYTHRNIPSNRNTLQRYNYRRSSSLSSSSSSSTIVQPRRFFFTTSDDTHNKNNNKNNNNNDNSNTADAPRNIITQYLSNLSPREEANLEDRILESFHNVLDHILNKDIHTLGWVTSVAFPSSSSSSSSPSGRTTDEDPPSSDVVLWRGG